jgi:uncharacterized protein (TIGR03437 family)
LANPGAQPVAANIYATLPGQPLSSPLRVSVPAGGAYYGQYGPSSVAWDQTILATAPLQMLSLSRYCPNGLSSCYQIVEPLPPMGMPALPPIAGSLLNAASAVEGAIAPGEIITLHGVDLQNAQVLIDGEPVQLLYDSDGQINAIVPFELAFEAAATIQLAAGDNTTTWSVPVISAAPGIFTLDGSGGGRAAVLNDDNSVNGPSQPAARGSAIQIFATGIGTETVVSVAIGGAIATVLYAGPAPLAVTGLAQINAIVPQNVSLGPAVPITLSVGTAQSPSGVTIAVQ